MLTERKSDPCHLTATPNTRKKRRIRRQRTALSRQSSCIEAHSQSSQFYQMIMNTKSAVQGIGYNVRNYFFDETRPVEIDENHRARVWLLGEPLETSDAFYSSWNRIMRMTYRKHWTDVIMNPITGVSYDSDTGWGCTIRSCQMLMAQVLYRVGLPNDRVASYFLDKESCLFSIQSFVNSQTLIPAGQWFGPASVSSSLKHIVESNEGRILGLGIVVSVDGQILLSDVIDQSRPDRLVESSPSSSPGRANSWELCTNTEGIALSSSFNGYGSPGSAVLVPTTTSQEYWVIDEDEHDGDSDESILEIVDNVWVRPVLVLVAMRLSPEMELGKNQVCALLSYMTVPSFVGLIGGPDRRCHFIPGVMEEPVEGDSTTSFQYTLLSVDPHIVQDADGSCDFKNALNPSRISPTYLCPSLAIGFLLKTQDDLDQLRLALGSSGPGSFIEISSSSSSSSKPAPPCPVIVML